MLDEAIEYFKNQLASTYDAPVDTLTIVQTEYLSHLDYTDMRHLCRVNQSLSTLCYNDPLLKQLVYNKTGLVIDKQYNVAKMLYQLDTMFDNVIGDVFPRLPDYIDEEKFYDAQKRELYVFIINVIYHEYEEWYYKNQGDKMIIKSLIAFYDYLDQQLQVNLDERGTTLEEQEIEPNDDVVILYTSFPDFTVPFMAHYYERKYALNDITFREPQFFLFIPKTVIDYIYHYTNLYNHIKSRQSYNKYEKIAKKLLLQYPRLY